MVVIIACREAWGPCLRVGSWKASDISGLGTETTTSRTLSRSVAEIVRLFALFHDSCRHDEYADPGHGPRGAQLAIDFRQAGHFHLDDPRMELLVTACRIHNGGMPQSNSTLAVCLDADRLDLGRVGITPDPEYLSTPTAKSIATRQAWHELEV